MKFEFYKNHEATGPIFKGSFDEYLFEKTVDKKDAELAKQEYQRAASILGLTIKERS